MFFAETLGPALTATSATSLAAFLRDRHGAAVVTRNELETTVAEFLRLTNNSTPVAKIIAYLGDRGVATPDGSAFRIAA